MWTLPEIISNSSYSSCRRSLTFQLTARLLYSPLVWSRWVEPTYIEFYSSFISFENCHQMSGSQVSWPERNNLGGGTIAKCHRQTAHVGPLNTREWVFRSTKRLSGHTPHLYHVFLTLPLRGFCAAPLWCRSTIRAITFASSSKTHNPHIVLVFPQFPNVWSTAVCWLPKPQSTRRDSRPDMPHGEPKSTQQLLAWAD